MKISELKQKLDEILASEGDIDVGFEDLEFRGYVKIDKIEARDKDKGTFLCSDDEQLSMRFVGLKYRYGV